MLQCDVRKIVQVCALLVLMTGCTVFGPGGKQKRLMALRSTDPDRRIQTLSRLEGKVTPPMRGTLEDILRNDMSPSARGMAADALGELGDKKSVKELRLSARRDSSWVVRRRALIALGEILGQEVAGDLRYALQNESDEAVLVEAVRLAAQRLNGQAQDETLLLGLRSSSSAVRLTAHQNLTEITGKNIPPGDVARWEDALEGPQPAQ
jgi:hypothetical protein